MIKQEFAEVEWLDEDRIGVGLWHQGIDAKLYITLTEDEAMLLLMALREAILPDGMLDEWAV